MITARPLVIFFKDIDKDDVSLVGGKGANLGEMTRLGLPVPDGFCLTVAAYDLFITENGLTEKIESLLKTLDPNDPAQLGEISAKIRRQVLNGELPPTIIRETISAYKKLSGKKFKLVAVRSSATAEDMPTTSFAGQQQTLLNIKGEANLFNAIRECWASLFTARSIFYRFENKIPHATVKISVVVQEMIQSAVSGVVFSLDPVTNEKDRIVIEAVWGLGEMIVQGSVIPDRYTVQKETFSILAKDISEQRRQLVRVGDKTQEIDVPHKLLQLQKIDDDDIATLAKLADKLQRHYYFPQDAEWAKAGGKKGGLYLVQTRPITTTKIKRSASRVKSDLAVSDTPILTGIAASPGIGTGPVKIIKSAKEIGKVLKGDVLVAPMTSPDFVPAMKKATAIVTDQGGQTSHAAIVSREMGTPCVVGTKTATKTLPEGQLVSVDGSKGLIYLGSKIISVRQEAKVGVKERKIRTATKIYVNLAEPDLAKEIAKRDIDGVGLLRAEFMMAEIGIHPKEAIKRRKQEKYIEKLVTGISTFCRAFNPRPVVYRATDFKTNEYRSLEGGQTWEPREPNPMLGFRGAFRYIARPDVFALELQALKEVQRKYQNIRLMVPFVRSPQELSAIRRVVAAEGLFAKPAFKFWMMVEIPSNVILIDEFIKVGLDGVSIGSNDLTMLVTGTDRDNSEVSQAFDERSRAVLWAIKRTIKKCSLAGVTTSICGQAPSFYDDYIAKLVKYGITSISVNPDAITRVRELVYRAEKEL